MPIQSSTKRCLSPRFRPRLRRRFRGSRPRIPPYLREALAALRRHLRIQRRLFKLAPQLYDERLIQENFAKQKESEAYDTEVFAAIARAYGSDPEEAVKKIVRCKNSAEMVQNQFNALDHALQNKIMRLTEESRLWLGVGRERLALFKSECSRVQVTFGQIASLLKVGVYLGRSAVGWPW